MGFVLAVRWRWLQPLFDGLDRMSAVHRWVGVSAMGAMRLHVRLEPEVEGGFDGLLARFMDAGTDAAELAEPAFYVLVAISVVRWVPYRWWRLSHKLLGVPFVFVALHTVTVDKPFPPESAWSLALAAISVVGVAAWLWRVVSRDGLRRGLPYRVVSAAVHQRTLELELSPMGRPLRHRVGRFAFVKMQLPGLREPHPFTIASAPGEDPCASSCGISATGPLRSSATTWSAPWCASRVPGYASNRCRRSDRGGASCGSQGVSASPRSSAPCRRCQAGAPAQERPLLVYVVQRAQAATAIEVLRRAAAEARIDLEVVASAEGRRLDAALLRELVGCDLTGAHVAVCGPRGLVATVARTARQLGAEEVESEDFDIRSGVGPDLSREIAGWDALWVIGSADRTRGRRGTASDGPAPDPSGSGREQLPHRCRTRPRGRLNLIYTGIPRPGTGRRRCDADQGRRQRAPQRVAVFHETSPPLYP